jgi:hypothetical protein
MAYFVVKTIRKRRYLYLQSSHRVGKKVRTRSIFIMLLMALVTGGLGGGKNAFDYGSKKRGRGRPKAEPVAPRSGKIRDAGMRVLNEKYGIDMSSRESFHRSFGRLSPELLKEYHSAKMSLERAHHAEVDRQKAAGPQSAKDAELKETFKNFGNATQQGPQQPSQGPSAAEPEHSQEQPAEQSATDAPETEPSS